MKREFSLRTEGSRPAWSFVRTLLGCGFTLGLAWAAYWSARFAWADHLSRSPELSDRQKAVCLFSSATLYDRLAGKREALGGDSTPDLQRAVMLEPENPAWRIRLGLRAELAGDYPLAERNLLKAADLSGLYQPRYLLAQYYFRRQNADLFHEWARAAFAEAYGDIAPLLELCWRLQPDAESLERLLPWGRPEISRQFLRFLSRRHQTGQARSLGLKLAAAASREDLPALLEYCDQSLFDGDSGAAAGVWNALCERRLLPDRPLDPSAGIFLTNSDFQHLPLDAGFDWRLARNSWLRFGQFDRAMRVTFSGSQPERCHIASQFVPVTSGVRYRLLAVAPAGEDVLDWMIFDGSGRPVDSVRGTDCSRVFVAPGDTLRLDLVYQRPLGQMRLNGTVTITEIRLERVP